MNAAEVVKPQKQVNAQNQIWHFSEKGQTFIGFTESFLETVRECWHVTPSHRTQATENAPLMSIETDDAFFSIASPVSGAILRFDSMAMNFPDKLTDATNIFIIGEKAVKSAERAPRAGPVEEQRNPTRFTFNHNVEEFHDEVMTMPGLPLSAFNSPARMRTGGEELTTTNPLTGIVRAQAERMQQQWAESSVWRNTAELDRSTGEAHPPLPQAAPSPEEF